MRGEEDLKSTSDQVFKYLSPAEQMSPFTDWAKVDQALEQRARDKNAKPMQAIWAGCLSQLVLLRRAACMQSPPACSSLNDSSPSFARLENICEANGGSWGRPREAAPHAVARLLRDKVHRLAPPIEGRLGVPTGGQDLVCGIECIAYLDNVRFRTVPRLTEQPQTAGTDTFDHTYN